MKNNFARNFKTVNTQSPSAGFTLIELLVAMSLTLIVTSISGFGLVAMMTNNNKAEARTQRRTEINRALDFISNEVRMARKINPTSPTDNTTTTAGAAVVASNTLVAFNPSSPFTPLPGIDITNVSDLAKIVLYLEIPITGTPPETCPAIGVAPPAAPPAPSTYDRVVYYILSDSPAWLGPRVIRRYGRTPKVNGTIDPCSIPGKETFIDSISDSDINPDPTDPTSNLPCPSATPAAIRSGKEGFYACVNGRDVSLYLRSKVATTQFPAESAENASTKAFSRIPPPPP